MQTKRFEKFLLKNGAKKVIYPERDEAYRMAVEFSSSSIFDYFKLSDDAGIYEIAVPDKWVGKSLADINVRKNHNVTVIAYKDNGRIITVKSPDYVLLHNQGCELTAHPWSFLLPGIPGRKVLP